MLKVIEILAQSDKSWVGDPAGLRWETFYTFGEATSYGSSAALAELEQTQAKASAGQYLSQPQQMRSGCGGFNGNFLAIGCPSGFVPPAR